MVNLSKYDRVIIAIDPGVDTGLACMAFSLGDGVEDYTIVEAEEVKSGELGEMMAAAEIASWVAGWMIRSARVMVPVELVSEDFVLRGKQKDRSLLAPVRMLGLILSELSHQHGTRAHMDRSAGAGKYGVKSFRVDYGGEFTEVCPFTVQQASEAKGSITDDRLKDWGLWVRGKRHGRDAIRHAVLRWRKVRDL